MNQTKSLMVWVVLMALALAGSLYAGTTGKIAGTITEKATGEALPGANIIVTGTRLGAVTDINGRFTILEVPPGTYALQVTFLGHQKTIINDVRVYIDQTARIDVAMVQEAIDIGDVVVVAERPLIKPDVATSVVAVSGTELKSLPVANVTDVMGMQAGIDGNQIRGVGLDEALFMVDGVTMRDPRNNQALTKVALSTVREISVERGGFNAEYGQVQSGIVNVITNEGRARGYSGSLNLRLTPPARKYFHGDDMPDVSSTASYWLRPFFDDAVCWTGTTSGAWDTYTQSKFLEFEGWNAVSQQLCTDNDPDNDLTPLAAQRVFEYYTRKKQINDQPDYEIDGGFGGPVPLVSKMLGNLRFFASYRGQKSLLIWPSSRPDYKDYDARIVLNSDVSDAIKLRISGLSGNISTMAGNRAVESTYKQWPYELAGTSLGTGGYELFNMFSDWTYGLAERKHNSLSAKMTHMLSKSTYYELSAEYFHRNYDTHSPSMRDTSVTTEIIPGYFSTATPYGVFYGIDGIVSGINEGNQNALARDKSNVSATTFKIDLTSQANFNNLVKAGAEFTYNDLDLDYGYIRMQSGGMQYDNQIKMREFPIRAAFYLQDKLETKGFILNAGLRLDYSNSRTDWWALDAFNPYFYSYKYNENIDLATTGAKGQWQLSPRLGISHPITAKSKLYFNYGHFKQMPTYESQYRFDRSTDNTLVRFGDPNLTLAKTIAYELGYDHELLDGQLLLQLAAFYRDISDQQNTTSYRPAYGTAYTVATSTAYSDIRGFELTLRKSAGRWFYGFLNYTYQATSNGAFGQNYVFEDPKSQQDYDENTVNIYQTRSVPSPYARANFTFATPRSYGPTLFNHAIFGDLLANILLRWNQGGWTTYNPNNAGTTSFNNNTNNKIQNNVQFLDYYDATLRLSKSIQISKINLQVFADINNLFNTRRLTNSGDQNYRKSLHLPKSDAYNNIPGDDRFGDFREPGVEWQPMENGVDFNSIPSSNRAWYYDKESNAYWYYMDDATIPVVQDRWAKVDQAKVDQAIEDKAYINMPNPSTYWFLNPRTITFGFRIAFDID
ncbi:MAG TPA: TonB-dependent receptor [bacterium]|nr:TonB-dependent receptor [bacterium]HPG82250.1 TonB-dependent receptor [bacterium]